jgi:hypothetical protein
MTPVFQTIIGNGDNGTVRGNCMQAAIASLLDMKLENVPNFIQFDSPNLELYNFLKKNGYEIIEHIHNPANIGWVGKCAMNEIEKYEGVNGYFYAAVYSPAFADFNKCKFGGLPTTHAVIINKDFQIVHDPNPNNTEWVYPFAHLLDYNGVINFYIINKKDETNTNING